VDSDCETFYGECPFGCHIAINKQFVQPAQQLIKDWLANEEKQGNSMCVYGCVQLLGVQCQNQHCTTRSYLPEARRTESDYAMQNEIDLAWFKESSNDTKADLEKRRQTVDDRMHGKYEECSLSADGKYVACP
jgi:hypothetical protein